MSSAALTTSQQIERATRATTIQQQVSALLVTVPQGSRLVVLRCWALCWGCSTWLLGGPLGCSVPWLPALPFPSLTLGFCGTGWRFYRIDDFVFPITSHNTKHALKPYTSNLQVPIKPKLHSPNASGPVVSHACSRRCHH